jgi:predicted O-methyltransferase YrrM
MSVFAPHREIGHPDLDRVLRCGRARRASEGARAAARRIEAARPALEADSTPVAMTASSTTVGAMARRASSPPARGLLLYAAVEVWQPKAVLEMGTCCGVSGAYIASALPDFARFVSLELWAPLADAARRLWADLGVCGEVRVGLFADTLAGALQPAPDVAFVDGNHHQEPTWEYFEVLADACPSGSLLVFDDITWSQGMKSAWQRIRFDHRVAASVTSGSVGLAVTR